jgi:DNA-binding transcriptional ArsR family regulator
MTVEKCTIPAGGDNEKHPARCAGSPDIDQMMQNAHRASHFLKALSHETRLVLLCLLAEGERSVTDLENILELRQPAVSQQLARLRLDGLVSTRRDGKVIYYSIANEDIRRAIMLVYEVFCKDGVAAGKKLHPWQS